MTVSIEMRYFLPWVFADKCMINISLRQTVAPVDMTWVSESVVSKSAVPSCVPVISFYHVGWHSIPGTIDKAGGSMTQW